MLTSSEAKVRRRVSVESLMTIPFLPTLANSEPDVITNSFSSEDSLMVTSIPFGSYTVDTWTVWG